MLYDKWSLIKFFQEKEELGDEFQGKDDLIQALKGENRSVRKVVKLENKANRSSFSCDACPMLKPEVEK